MQLEDEEPRVAQQREPELEHDPGHTEPEPAEQAEAAAEADREADAGQAEADAGKHALGSEKPPSFSFGETRLLSEGSSESLSDPSRDQTPPTQKASRALQSYSPSRSANRAI